MTDEELLTALRIKSEWVGSPSLYDIAADRLRSLLTQNQKMREALEPFANYATDFDMDGRYDNAEIFIRIGPCRIARALLHGATPATPADEAEPLPKATIEDPKIVYHWGHQRIDYSCAPHFRIVFDE